jgi:hypothetical protein
LIIVTEQQSWVEGEATSVMTRFDNKLAWIPSSGGRVIIAVGGPAQWNSTQPLPPEALVTDLVTTSLADPVLAGELWGPFLAYVGTAAKQKRWRFSFSGIFRTNVAIRVDIQNLGVRAAVKSAIEKSRFAQRRFVCE